MKMNLNEMEALYAFGCPNRKATIERLRCSRSCGEETVLYALRQAECRGCGQMVSLLLPQSACTNG